MAAGTTIAAQLGVTPLLLFHFHEVPGVTIVANLAAFPAVAPALLLGIAASALGLVWLPLGHAVALVARVPMRYLEIVAATLAKAPVAWVTSEGGPWVLIVGAGVFVGLALWAHGRWRPSRRFTTVVLAFLPIVVWQAAVSAGPPDALTVRVLDIGQGDAILISSPGGSNVLIDGGPDEELAAQRLVAVRREATRRGRRHAPARRSHRGSSTGARAVPRWGVPRAGVSGRHAAAGRVAQEIDAQGIPVRRRVAGD